jgi:hypothetical protein
MVGVVRWLMGKHRSKPSETVNAVIPLRDREVSSLYDDNPDRTNLRLRKRRHGRSAPIDHIALEERRHERINLSKWLCEPVRDHKIKSLRIR